MSVHPDWKITPRPFIKERIDEDTTPFTTAWRDAIVLKTTDADTFKLSVDLGFSIKHEITVRLMGLIVGVDAWEKRGETKHDGMEAMAAAINFIGDNNPERKIRIKTLIGDKKGGFNRYLAAIAVERNGEWRSLGDYLLANGHARVWWSGIQKQYDAATKAAPPIINRRMYGDRRRVRVKNVAKPNYNDINITFDHYNEGESSEPVETTITVKVHEANPGGLVVNAMLLGADIYGSSSPYGKFISVKFAGDELHRTFKLKV